MSRMKRQSGKLRKDFSALMDPTLLDSVFFAATTAAPAVATGYKTGRAAINAGIGLGTALQGTKAAQAVGNTVSRIAQSAPAQSIAQSRIGQAAGRAGRAIGQTATRFANSTFNVDSLLPEGAIKNIAQSAISYPAARLMGRNVAPEQQHAFHDAATSFVNGITGLGKKGATLAAGVATGGFSALGGAAADFITGTGSAYVFQNGRKIGQTIAKPSVAGVKDVGIGLIAGDVAKIKDSWGAMKRIKATPTTPSGAPSNYASGVKGWTEGFKNQVQRGLTGKKAADNTSLKLSYTQKDLIRLKKAVRYWSE